MPSRPSSASTDAHAYIPPGMEQAMTQQLQSSLPAHLKQYVGQDKPAYVPRHIEKQLAQHMQKNLSGHLKEYSGAYIQQRVIQPSAPSQAPAPLAPRPPAPDLRRLDHSMPVGQYTPQMVVSPEAAPQTQPSPSATVNPTQPPPNYPPAPNPAAQPNDYGFIMDPGQPKSQLSFPGSGSMIARVAIIGGGLIILLILFSIIKGILAGPSNTLSLTKVAQDQQELIHLATNANKQQGLTVTSQNFAVTSQLSLTSSQTQLLTYMQLNKKKVGVKQLNLKVSLATDNQLTAALADSTYDQTFQQTMQTQLNSYEQDLKSAYSQTTGPKGHQLLSNSYNQAQLLLQQLSSPAS